MSGAPGTTPMAPAAIVERVVLAIVNEGYHALGEGVAGRGDIDLALQLGASHPVGPFARVSSLGGPSSVVRRLRELEADVDARFAPAPLLVEDVD